MTAAAIIGAKTPAEGDETTHVVKSKGRTNTKQGGHNTANRRATYIKKEKCLGVDPNVCGHVFEAKRNQSEHVSNFTIVNDTPKAHTETICDTFVIKSPEKETKTFPNKQKPVTADDGSMLKMKGTKCEGK